MSLNISAELMARGPASASPDYRGGPTDTGTRLPPAVTVWSGRRLSQGARRQTPGRAYYLPLPFPIHARLGPAACIGASNPHSSTPLVGKQTVRAWRFHAKLDELAKCVYIRQCYAASVLCRVSGRSCLQAQDGPIKNAPPRYPADAGARGGVVPVCPPGSKSCRDTAGVVMTMLREAA